MSLIMSLKYLRSPAHVGKTHLKGRVSQMCDIGLGFCLMYRMALYKILRKEHKGYPCFVIR